jgi:hypothetical protein
MSDLEFCPKCSHRFESRGTLVYGGVPLIFGIVTAPGVSTKVRCPGCGHLFSAEQIRFFGFLSADALRWALVLGVIGSALVIAISSLR